MAAEMHEVVVKSNRLVEASYRLSLIEQQFVLFSICKARETQLGLSTDTYVTINAREFADQFGIDPRNAYTQLKDAALRLWRRELYCRDLETGEVKFFRWIDSGSYAAKQGTVKIRFGLEVIPHLTRLDSEFTQYRLEKVGSLTSAHAIRMYELLLQYLAVGKREFDVCMLRTSLDIFTEYRAMKDFKKRVLDLAVEQINEFTDLQVSYTQRKTGKAVSHFIFDIKSKKELKPAAAPKPTKKPVVNAAYIRKHARPGESEYDARMRLLEQIGQQRLVE